MEQLDLNAPVVLLQRCQRDGPLHCDAKSGEMFRQDSFRFGLLGMPRCP
jgi:hypothetical protein